MRAVATNDPSLILTGYVCPRFVLPPLMFHPHLTRCAFVCGGVCCCRPRESLSSHELVFEAERSRKTGSVVRTAASVFVEHKAPAAAATTTTTDAPSASAAAAPTSAAVTAVPPHSSALTVEPAAAASS